MDSFIDKLGTTDPSRGPVKGAPSDANGAGSP